MSLITDRWIDDQIARIEMAESVTLPAADLGEVLLLARQGLHADEIANLLRMAINGPWSGVDLTRARVLLSGLQVKP